MYLGSLLPKPCSMKEYKYIYILVLLCQVSVCHATLAQGYLAKCRNVCVQYCERTWDNGRKKCCEGRGEISQDLDIYCNNGLCDCYGGCDQPWCVSAMIKKNSNVYLFMLQSSVNLLIYAPQIKGALSIKCNKGRKGTLLRCKKHVLKWLILYIG